MKVLLFGCKDTTLHVAGALTAMNIRLSLTTISPEKGDKQKVAGYFDLTSHYQLFDEIYIANRYDLKDNQDIEYFQNKQFDLGISIGWQRLIPPEILKEFKIGVFGMHGSAQDLPFGRGRSPMNWSILEGRQWFFTNLFKYDSGIDNGPILDTECFSINSNDTAETMHFKNTLSLVNLLKKNWDNFTNQKITLKPQKEGKGSVYLKREPSDGLIDWRDSIHNIERLIRAVAKPFYCAFSYLGDTEFKILRASIFYTDIEQHQFKNQQYGEICDVFPNNKFLIRCNGGVLIVHEFEGVTKLLKTGEIFKSPVEKIRIFKRNIHGYFDQYPDDFEN